jgi:hypothetical protein
VVKKIFNAFENLKESYKKEQRKISKESYN